MRISKLIAAIVGVLVTLTSLALAVGGGIAMALPDDDGWVSAGPIRLRSEAAALVADDIEIDVGGTHAGGRTLISWGEIPALIDVTSRNDEEVFVGITTQDDADAYLAGVAHDQLSSLHDDHDIEFVPGVFSADPPTETDIWVASSVDGHLEWDVESGEWAIVVVNADGSPGIDVGVEASARLNFLRPIGAVLLALGILGLAGGSALIYLGVRRVRDDRNAATAPPAPATGPVMN